ncbi:MAG: hypothetical protein K9N40_09870 [Candidatus Cloacimonetes bacterium]|nr:hypothetical protein [Candidatus Cloacimonadota bacterium]
MKYILLLLTILPGLLLAQTITPIASIQDSTNVYNGQIVTIEGLVTIGVGITHDQRCNVFIQDDSDRGMMIFDYDITSAYENDLIRGNEVRVTGEVDEYNGVTELTDFSYQVLSTGNPDPVPVYLELNQYLNDYEGTFVKVIGTVSDPYYAGGGWNLTVEDLTGGTTIIRVWDSTGIDVSEFVDGYLLQAIGVGSIYNNSFQILAGYQDHLGPGEYENYPWGDISTTIAGKPVEITFGYPETFNSVDLYWKTNADLNWNLEEMTLFTNVRIDSFMVQLPSFKQGEIVSFYIEAFEADGDTLILPEEFPAADPFFFNIDVPKLKAVLTVPPKAFNPYMAETFPIEFGSRSGDKVILRIYNAEGKLMVEPLNNILSGSGITRYNWNGKDKDNKLVPLGLYICYLEVTNTINGSKSTAKAPIVVGAPLK